MKMLQFILFTCFAATLSAQDVFVINGTSYPETFPLHAVVMRYENANGQKMVDTAFVRNGKFSLSGQVIPPSMVVFQMLLDTTDGRQNRFLGEVWYAAIDNSAMELDYRGNGIHTLKGSATHDDEKAFEKEFLSQVLHKPMETFIPIKERLMDSFVRAKPGSAYNLLLLYDAAVRTRNPSHVQSLFMLLPSKFKQTPKGKRIAEQIEALSSTVPGRPAPGVSLPDAKGRVHSLDSFRGKYVLLEFWATWCIPCRIERPNLVKAFKELKKRNIVFVGISLDRLPEKKLWLQAVASKYSDWLQLCDFAGSAGKVPTAFGVTGVPMNFLIDPNGIVVAKNLRGDGLTQKISAFLK